MILFIRSKPNHIKILREEGLEDFISKNDLYNFWQNWIIIIVKVMGSYNNWFDYILDVDKISIIISSTKNLCNKAF